MNIQTLYPDLQRAIDGAQIAILGEHDVRDTAHARTMAALLRCYGDSEAGFLYAEPIVPDSDYAPDIVLAHPETGVLVLEVKAYDIEFIQGVEAGNLLIRGANGDRSAVSPLRQAQRSMYAIRDAFAQLALSGERPFFNAMVALPNIREGEWVQAGYEASIHRRLILFQDDLLDFDRLQSRIKRAAHQGMSLAGLHEAFPASATDTLYRVFGGGGILAKRDRSPRALPFDNLGAEIDRMESQHKELSPEQQSLIRLNTWGHPYLLRGVAGSGKSIVLAYHVAWALIRHERKAMQLTLFDEDRHTMPKIAVVCLHRTLVPLLERYIGDAYESIMGRQPDTAHVQIAHLNGLIYDLAAAHAHFHYIPMNKALDTGDRSRKYLAQLDTMTEAELDDLRFDALYIDEGQDIHPDTLALLHTLVRPDAHTKERTLSIYYDDAQNIYGHPRPTWRNFGMNVEGGRASFMKQAYRNSREILELSMNVLLGTAADEKTRVQTRRYADIYTLKEKELAEEALEGWRLHFAQPSGDAPLVEVFNNRPDQADWVAEMVAGLVLDEGVRPDDILILAASAKPLPHIERRIHAMDESAIQTRVVGGKNRAMLDEPLLMPEHLTLATVYAAKGYDAPIVILLDVDQIPTTVTGRAMFYVGATRAKRYLMICGVKRPDSLLSEAHAMHKRLFEGY